MVRIGKGVAMPTHKEDDAASDSSRAISENSLAEQAETKPPPTPAVERDSTVSIILNYTKKLAEVGADLEQRSHAYVGSNSLEEGTWQRAHPHARARFVGVWGLLACIC